MIDDEQRAKVAAKVKELSDRLKADNSIFPPKRPAHKIAALNPADAEIRASRLLAEIDGRNRK